MKQQIVTKEMRQSGNESCSVFFSEIQAGGITLGMWCLSYLVLIFTILALRGIDIRNKNSILP